MAKVVDHLMKILAKANRQHLVSLVLPGATYASELATFCVCRARL
jgi:hypothetical protein